MSAIFGRLAVLSGLLFSVACSGADDRPDVADFTDEDWQYDAVAPDAGNDVDVAPDADAAGPVCEEGATQRCTVKLPSQNGVANCFNGVQQCEGGQWGACLDPADLSPSNANQGAKTEESPDAGPTADPAADGEIDM
jgi:hypothetical protein